MRLSRILFLLVLIPQVLFSQIDTLLICAPGDEVQLSAPEGGTLHRWSPRAGLNNPNIANPTASPVWNTLYSVEMTGQLIGENLIQNHDFELGNEGIESEYPFVDRISTQGVYGVSDSAAKLNGIFFTDCPDHTSGEGLMMVIDGSPVPNVKVWCQEVEVKANTMYAFSTWLASVLGSNPAQLQFFINDEPLGEIFTAIESVCQWRQFYEVWSSGDATQAEICIINKNTDPNGNDFALDDFMFIETEGILLDSTQVILDNIQVNSEILTEPDCEESDGVVRLEVTDPIGEVSYSLDGLSFQDSPVFENLARGEYKLFVKDEISGLNQSTCLIEEDLIVNQKRCPIYIPNIIDIENNDSELFVINTHPLFDGTFTSFSVFDRWGTPIYTSTNHETITVGWNGFMKDGQSISAGVYSYIVQIAYPDGTEESKVGNVTILK